MRARLVETIERATEAGLVEDYEVRLVGDELCLCEDCRELHLAGDTYEVAETVRSWRQGEVRPDGFETRTVDSAYTEEHHEVLRTPAVTVCLQREGSLSGVFPCTDGETHVSVSAFIDHLTSRLSAQTTAGEKVSRRPSESASSEEGREEEATDEQHPTEPADGEAILPH